MSIELREARASDAEAVSAVTALSADGGAVSFRTRAHVDPFHEHDAMTESVGVVAEQDGSSVIGAAQVRLGHCWYEGRVRPFALLHSLVVHPDHRRNGIGTALATWRIERARAHIGRDGVVLANIQAGNEGSTRNASKWATAWVGPAIVAPIPMRRRPPRPVQAVRLSEATGDDLAETAAGLARFSGSHNFSLDWSRARLEDWLRSSPLPEPVNHQWIARDATGRIVAGLGIREEGRIRSLEVMRMPVPLRVVNSVVRVVPPDGVLRNLTIDKFWFEPGRLDAARALIEHIRWAWRDRGSNILVTLDARSPVREAIGGRPWYPTTAMSVAVACPTPPTPFHPFTPLL